MSYAINILDPTKESNYLVKIRFGVNGYNENIYQEGSFYYIDWPFEKPIGYYGGAVNNYSVISRSTLNDLGNINPQDVAINDLQLINVEYIESEKRLRSLSSSFLQLLFAVEVYISAKQTRTYRDPLDDSTDIIQYTPDLISEPEVTRDISNLLNGFSPVITSNIEVSRFNNTLNITIYDATFDVLYSEVSIYHSVGDNLDVTNNKLIFTGKIADYSVSNTSISFSVTDQNIKIESTAQHPQGDIDYSNFNLYGYNVKNEETGFSQRKIYGFADYIRGVNIDRDTGTPTTSNNRIYSFANYSGDNTKIEDVNVTAASYTGTVVARLFDNGPTDKGIKFARTYNKNTATEQDIINLMNLDRIITYDRIRVTFSKYPGEVFYFEPYAVQTRFNYLTASFDYFSVYAPTQPVNSCGSYETILYIRDIRQIIAAQTGDTIAQVSAKLDNGIQDVGWQMNIQRGVCSNIYMRDKNGINRQLDYGTHYTTFRDPVNYVYGVELVNNVEAIIPGLGYTPLDGNEILFGRVWGEDPVESNYTGKYYSITGNGSDIIGFTACNNSNINNVIYSFFKDYLKLDDSSIDLDKFELLKSLFDIDLYADNSNLKAVFNFRRNLGASNYAFTCFPKNISDKMPTIKEQITHFAQLFGLTIFINNENKWSFKVIDQEFVQLPKATIGENQFELLSEVNFSTTDIFRYSKITFNYAEIGVDSANDGAEVDSYIRFGSSYKSDEYQSQEFIAFAGMPNQSESLRNEPGAPIIVSSWPALKSGIYKYRICSFDIKVGRDLFNLDLGDVIAIESDLIPKKFRANVEQRFIILKITQLLDFRILTVADILTLHSSQTDDFPFDDRIIVDVHPI